MFAKTHAIISVDNRGRNEGISRSATNFQYQLTQPINFTKRSKDKQYFIRIQNANIPISFYNINSNYDTFGWTGSATGAVSFNITHGNYTIDEIIAEVQVQMNLLDTNTYTLTYDEITQKVNIASDGVENVSALTGDGWQVLGFDLTETITGASNVDGTNVAYTNTAGQLKLIISNLVSNNVYSNEIIAREGIKHTIPQNVSLLIPITETRNEFQFYDNNDGPLIKLPGMSSIRNFNVRLSDRFNNTVDLNGVPFSFDIVIYEWNKMPWDNK